MGFKLWTIADDHCRMLTESGFKMLLANEVSVGGLTHDPERDGLETEDCHE